MPYLIKFFQAGCGDAIDLSYRGESGTRRHLLIDGGFMITYMAHLKKKLIKLPKDEFIDLWVVTHMDNDHINGPLAHFKDESIREGKELIKELWFNCFERFTIPDQSSKTGIASAIGLRDKLTPERCANVVQKITNDMDELQIDGARITILSPDTAIYDRLAKEWEELEAEFHARETKGKTANEDPIYPDDQETIEKLVQRKQVKEDLNDTPNRSSIAFLFEYNGLSVLFMGDAHPSVVIAAIKQINEKRGSKLKVDYIKLAHHASRHNFHTGLLEVVDCNNFIVLSKGLGCHGLPNKEPLARIAAANKDKGGSNFYFNYNQARFQNMFSQEERKTYGIGFHFPEDGQLFLKLGNEF